MPEITEEIIRLQSVPLTRDKMLRISREFEIYHNATNFVIKAILKEHIPTSSKTFELVKDEFVKQFDPRPQYLNDVIKTARVEIGKHRKMAAVVRSFREKIPAFKPGRIIVSPPIVRVREKALLLYTKENDEIPIPYDKPTRNRVIDKLRDMVNGSITYGRVRLTLQRAGYIKIDIRARTETS